MTTKYTRFTNVEVTGKLKAADLDPSNVFKGVSVNASSATIQTTSSADAIVIVPRDGVIANVSYSGALDLAANDTNFVTWSITNFGQNGSGNTAILAGTDANTTKATGGSAIVANARRNLTLNATPANLVVAKGDRLRIRALVTGTLANTVTFNQYLVEINVE